MDGSFKELLMMKGSSKIVNVLAGVKKDEQVLIVTDYPTVSIARSLAAACVAVGAEPTLMIMRPREAHGLEPPEVVAAAMTKVDVVLEPVSKSIAHTSATKRAREAGARVTTPLGTDIVMSLESRPGRALHGLARERGGDSCPSNIEASIAPVEGGLAKEIRGAEEAQKLKKILESANDPKVYNVGELGVGLNPNAKLCGLMLEDEGAFGSVHIALGSNADFGGKTKAARHIDLTISQATLILDDKPILRNGEVVV